MVRNYHSFTDSCNFTNKTNSNTFKVEMHRRKNYVILGSLATLLANLSKKFCPSNWAEVFISVHTKILVVDTQISETGPAQSTRLI